MNFETQRIIEILERMKKRPGMYLGSEEEGSIWSFIMFMDGLENGTEAEFSYSSELIKKCKKSQTFPTNEDISIRDAIQFAIDLVKEKGIPTPTERQMKKALE